MLDKDELSRALMKIFSEEELEVDLSDEVHGKIYAANGIELHLFVPKNLSYIQFQADLGVITDKDICALPLYCLSENARDDSWPRRVFGIDPERRMITYSQAFSVIPNANFSLKDSVEGLAQTAWERRNEMHALVSSIDSSALDDVPSFSEELIFKA